MLSGSNDSDYLQGVNPNSKNYQDNPVKDHFFSTAYGPRIMSQMQEIIDELIKDEGSRRAVINILLTKDKWILKENTKTEYPCVETLSYYIRDNKFYSQCNMRSNNMVTTLVYDVFAFTMFQEYVYNRLLKFYPKLQMGSYKHHCTSAHYFSDQDKLITGILNQISNPHLFRSDKVSGKVIGEKKWRETK